LLAAPGGLSTFLSTFNYTLYLLTYASAKSAPLQAKLYQLFTRSPTTTAVDATTHLAALGGLLSSTRTTLRLFGLFPLYAWLRQLMQGPKPGDDSNVAVLTDAKALPMSWSQRWHLPASSGKAPTANIYLWSYRAWLGGVLCDFVRLFRTAQLERQKRAERSVTTDFATREHDEKADQAWWKEMVVPLSWTPMALHFAIGEGGLPGWNLGAMGACGAFAGLGKIADMWAKTA
ncbi:hypothetical protein BTJ68_15276, partial [Hortaea werneckii EXF-2000]